MNKKISGSEFTLAKIFSSDFEYIIPSYQRPYAWTTNETEVLFETLYDFYQTEQEEAYFLGSIVLIKSEDNPLAEVIDGQQRLTTLTILLSVLASFFDTNDDSEYRENFELYIKERGRKLENLEAKPRLTLREKDKNFFSKYIQNIKLKDLFSLDKTQLENESQQNILENAMFLHKKIQEVFNQNKGKLKEFCSFLVQRCYLIAVSTPNQESAFRMFSVMNSTGLDLQPTDIIKAEVIDKLKTNQEKYNKIWEQMEIDLGRNSFNDLFSYIRMIYAKEKAKKTLLEEFTHKVLELNPEPDKFIDEILEPYSKALVVIKQNSYIAEKRAEEIKNYIYWLNKIDNSDWIPVAIKFLVDNNKKPNSDYVEYFFNKLERLASFMHICAYNINARINRYKEILEALEQEHSLENPIQAMELTPEEKIIMINQLNGNIYELTSRRRNYIILRLDSFISDKGARYNPSILTIEHVLPQTVNSKSEWNEGDWENEEIRKQWTHKIANLIPLNRKRNSQAQNYDFQTKKEKYFKGSEQVSSYNLTTQIINTQNWTPDFLEERQNELLKEFKKNWDL